MIPTFTPLMLMASAMFIIVCYGFAGVLVSKVQSHEKRLAARREDVLRQHIHAQPVDVRVFSRPAPTEKSFKTRLVTLFGIDLDRPDVVPVPWWLVVLATGVLAEVATSAVASLFGTFVWLAFPLCWIGASKTVFGFYKSKRRNRLIEQFPDALMMIVRSVRVGVPVSEAMFIVSHEQPEPTAGEFAMLANQLSIGEPLDKAILAMARHADVPDYRFFAIALTLQAKAGGALSGTLENLADMMRKRVAVKERAHALASEARMSIYVLTGLPVLVGGGMALLNPAYIGVLITDPLGNKMLTGAVMLLLTGLGTMQIIVKKSVS